MIIDIRGTNGSGKSHTVFGILERYEHQQMHHPAYVWVPALNLAILGKYATACGGCDGINRQDTIVQAVKHGHEGGQNVILEGCIVASVFKRWNDLAAELGNYTFMFLDTPINRCIEQVESRRLRAGNTKEFDATNTLVPRHNAILRVREKLIAAGRNCEWLDHTRATDQVLERLSG